MRYFAGRTSTGIFMMFISWLDWGNVFWGEIPPAHIAFLIILHQENTPPI